MTYRWYIHRPNVTDDYVRLTNGPANYDQTSAESEIRALLDKATAHEATTFFRGRRGLKFAVRLRDNMYAFADQIEDPVKFDFKITSLGDQQAFSAWRRENNAKTMKPAESVHAPRPDGRLLLQWDEQEVECDAGEIDEEVRKLIHEGVSLTKIRVWEEVKFSISVGKKSAVG